MHGSCRAVAWALIWYLIQTKSREEHRAKAQLERQGYECYYPRDGDGPFFPGYVFVRAEDRDYTPIKSTRGVQKLVGFPQPLGVSDSVIDAYKQTDWIRSDEFEAGANVIVNEHGGLLAHTQALLKARKGDRAVILISFLGRQQEAIVPLKAVSKR